LDELATWSGARSSIAVRKIAGIPNVPALEVTLPLSEGDPDECLKVFLTFLHWPRPKSSAWARFSNSNPPVNARDIESMTFYYVSSAENLTFALRDFSGKFVEDIDATITYEALDRISSLETLRVWR
jgi:hypothetical protein